MSANKKDHMSPANSPGEQSGQSGVRRVNNMPVYIVVGGLAIFLLIMVVVASDRAAKQNQPGQHVETGKAGNTSMFAMEIAGEQRDGMIQAIAAAPLVVPDLAASPSAIVIARPANLDLPPVPPGALAPPNSQQQVVGQQTRDPHNDDADRIRMMKMQQFDEAVKAKTSLSVIAPRSAGSSPAPAPVGMQSASVSRDEALARLAAVRQQIEVSTRDDPTAAYRARLQQIQSGGGGGDGGGDSAPRLIQAPSGRNEIAKFAGNGNGEGDRWRLDSQPQPPRTPYELRAGFVVPATLISGMNSELPGQIVAQVSQDVYDTPLGRYRLIPQGSRLVGSYSSEVAFGQSRIFVAWQRIVFPDGKAMDIGSMPGADSAGYSGFKDQVNSHFVRLFSSAFLMSGVTAGVALSQPQTGNANARPTASSAMSEALGQQLGQVTAQLIAKNLNIAPTLEIRPGYRFNVVVVKDMSFSKPYAPFDY